jgi:hypothetical protein
MGDKKKKQSWFDRIESVFDTPFMQAVCSWLKLSVVSVMFLSANLLFILAAKLVQFAPTLFILVIGGKLFQFLEINQTQAWKTAIVDTMGMLVGV